MQIALITAETGKAADTHIAVCQIIFCQFQTGIYDVLPAGAAEKLFIEMLEMGKAQAEGSGKPGDGPGSGRVIVYLGAQSGKIRIIFLDAGRAEALFQFFLQRI